MEIVKAGFDITAFETVDDWRNLMEKLELTEEPIRTEKHWRWNFSEGFIATEYNPFTETRFSHYFSTEQEYKSSEPGLVGYIGIEGSASFVAIAFLRIKETADYIKNEEFGRRSYI